MDSSKEPLLEENFRQLQVPDLSSTYETKGNEDGKIELSRLEYLAQEAGKQVAFAIPMIGMNILQYLLNLVAVIVVGHVGKLELAASSIATTMVNISGHIMLVALSSALETFCGQAYGAEQYHLVGQYTQQATVILSLCSLPIALFWLYLEPALLVLGQDPLISAMAGQYAWYLLPSLFASVLTQPLVKFFQVQGVTYPLVYCQLAALLVHIPLIYVLMWPLGLGYLGAAVSASVAWWVNVVLMLLYLRFSGLPTFELTWTGLSLEALNPAAMAAFLQLAIPSALMLCLEYWCFEVIIIFAGLLPDPDLQVSVISVGYSISSLSWVVPYGLGSAVSTRVANEFGANRPMAAKRAAQVSYLVVVLAMTLLTLSLLAFRHPIAALFVSDAEVIASVAALMPLVAVVCFNDGFSGINAGAIRGIGHQHLGAIYNLGAYYLVGIPASYGLAFLLGWGVKGLWVGLISGQALQAVLLASLVLFFTSWEDEARRVQESVEGGAEEAAEEPVPCRLLTSSAQTIFPCADFTSRPLPLRSSSQRSSALPP